MCSTTFQMVCHMDNEGIKTLPSPCPSSRQCGHPVTQADIQSPASHCAQAWILSQTSPCGICVEQSHTATHFSPSTSFFQSVSLHHCSTHIRASTTSAIQPRHNTTSWSTQLQDGLCRTPPISNKR